MLKTQVQISDHLGCAGVCLLYWVVLTSFDQILPSKLKIIRRYDLRNSIRHKPMFYISFVKNTRNRKNEMKDCFQTLLSYISSLAAPCCSGNFFSRLAMRVVWTSSPLRRRECHPTAQYLRFVKEAWQTWRQRYKNGAAPHSNHSWSSYCLWLPLIQTLLGHTGWGKEDCAVQKQEKAFIGFRVHPLLWLRLWWAERIMSYFLLSIGNSNL